MAIPSVTLWATIGPEYVVGQTGLAGLPMLAAEIPAGFLAEYKFLASTDGGATYATILQDWSTTFTIPLATTTPNFQYRVQVWVRTRGSLTDAPEASDSFQFIVDTIYHASTIRTLTLSITPQNTLGATIVTPGTPVILSVSASSGTTPYRAQYFVYDRGRNRFRQIQPWGAALSVTWTPATVGDFVLFPMLQGTGETFANAGLSGLPFQVVASIPAIAPGQLPAGPAASAYTPTHVWIWGSTVGYKSLEFPGLSAVTLAGGASAHAPVSDMLTALVSQGFVVQDAVIDGTVWGTNVEYDYLALQADVLFLAQHIFASFRGTGVGPPTTWSGIGFTPGLVFGRQGGTSFSDGAVFRGPAHSGTDSTLCSNVGATNDRPITGITAIGVDSVDFGASPAPTGDPFYAWAFRGGPSIAAPLLLPTFTLVPPTQPTACVVPVFGGPGSSPCAAPAPVFP